MPRRVFLLAGEYSVNPTSLTEERRKRPFLREWQPYADEPGFREQLFFKHPQGAHRRTTADDWQRKFGTAPIALSDLLASAAHRALCSFHELVGESDYAATRDRVTHLMASSMPGLDPNDRLNLGLLPQRLRALLDLDFRTNCHFQVGTSDSGAWAFAEAVRIARGSENATVLVTAGQIIPPGYAAQYHIRSVLGERDQRVGLDMLAIGDLLMDVLRRTHGVERSDVEEVLQAVARRKFDAARSYPAAMRSGTSSLRAKQITPYFDVDDIAPPCCGAAAAIVTSDEKLVRAIWNEARARVGQRYPTLLPVVEVLGVGEGSSNPSLVDRGASLAMAPSIRQALAVTADDAKLPPSVFAASAFAVLHDAFPSIELAFLLALGLDWDAATYRMRRPWPNPYGGLLTFGHALGASGLVQVVKSLHVFTNDRRHVREGERAGDELEYTFPRDGAYAFTSSVGGPLSHIVITLLRGGHTPSDHDAFHSLPALPEPERMPGREHERWREQRRDLHTSTEVYARRLRAYVRRDPGGEAWLVEGVSRVDLRSRLGQLRVEDLQLVTLAGANHRVLAEHVAAAEEVLRQNLGQLLSLEGTLEGIATYDTTIENTVLDWRRSGFLGGAPEETEELKTFIHSLENLRILLKGKAELADYDQAVKPLVAKWSRRRPPGREEPQIGAAPSDEAVLKIIGALKDALRLHLVLLLGPGNGGKLERRVELISAAQYEALVDCDVVRDTDEEPLRPLARAESDGLLPWWYARATRGPASAPPPGPHATADARQLFCLLHDESSPPFRFERPEDLHFLRTYFAPFIPGIALDLAIRNTGATPSEDPAAAVKVPIIFYVNDIIDSHSRGDARTSYALIGKAANGARGWLGMYRMTSVQSGDSVQIVCFDDRLNGGKNATRESIVSVARFARDSALFSLRFGLPLRAVVSLGRDGVRYEDVNGNPTVASEAQVRAARLLAELKSKERENIETWRIPRGRPWIAFDLTDVELDERDVEELLRRQLGGWKLHGERIHQIDIQRPNRSARVAAWYLPE